jgi:tRNA A37 methylthiotransferase MiaB
MTNKPKLNKESMEKKQTSQNLTENEIEKIIDIMSGADGGCMYCALDLIERFTEVFNLDKKLIKRITLKVAEKTGYYEEINKYLFNEDF